MEKVALLDSNTFGIILESTMHEKKLSHIDAIVEICRIRNLDVEVVAELITPRTKKLIQNEGLSLKMLKKRKPRKKKTG